MKGNFQFHDNVVTLLTDEKFSRNYATVGNINLTAVLNQVSSEKFVKKFVRSSGPGGQNVNKLNTKVELRLKLSEADWIPEEIRSELYKKERNSINKYGDLIVTAEAHREQPRNLTECLNKVKEMISSAAYVPDGPSSETIEKIAENKALAKERRVDNKRFRSQKKRDRKDIR